MKMKYILLLAAALFSFAAPMADAAPKKSKKSKKAKVTEVVADEFDIFSPTEAEDARNARKAAKEKKAAEEAEEKERVRSLSREERNEEFLMVSEDTKFHIENQRKTIKILRSVRDEKSAARAVKPLEKIYGEAIEYDAVDGEVTAMGTVKLLEEDETKIPVRQAYRSVVSSLNRNINKEVTRISALKITHKKFNCAIQRMMDAQR